MDERAEGGFAMSKLKITAFAGAALLGSIGAAAAMPSNALPQASKQVGAYVQDVRLVCGPGGCWHEPGYYHHWWHHGPWRYHHWY
jgi:hypothetical protein